MWETIDCHKGTSACASLVVKFEARITTSTHFATITRALRPRRCDTVGARTYIGHARSSVLTYSPTGLAFGYTAL